MYITENDLNQSKKVGHACEGEKRVEIVIDGDENTAWEGGINGVFYRIARGKRVSVPTSLAKLIYQNERVSTLSREQMKPYKTARGRRLN